MFAYKPKVEETFNLKLFEHYTYLKLPVWAWLKCKEVQEDANFVTAEVLNGAEPTGQIVTIPVGMIEKPLGWEEVYTITASSKEQAEKCLSWFAHGIYVWTNCNMSSRACGGHAFQSAETVKEAPHWKYAGKPTEVVPAADCAQRFIVKWEEFRSTPDKLSKEEKKTLMADGWTCSWYKQGRTWEIYRSHTLYTPPALNAG